MTVHGYKIGTKKELTQAKRFWTRHPEMLKGVKDSRPPRQMVRMEVSLNTGETLEEIFLPPMLEKWGMTSHQNPRQTLDVAELDSGIMRVEKTFEALSDEDLDMLTTVQVN